MLCRSCRSAMAWVIRRSRSSRSSCVSARRSAISRTVTSRRRSVFSVSSAAAGAQCSRKVHFRVENTPGPHGLMHSMSTRLDRPVDPARDHVVGEQQAAITLVEYGSYDCPHCRAANERITEVRQQLGERVRYVFRHRPIAGSELARRAAELVEQAATPEEFWSAHVALMTRSRTLTEEDLRVVGEQL